MKVRSIDVKFTRQIDVAVFLNALLNENWSCYDTIFYQVYDALEDFGDYSEAPAAQLPGVIRALQDGFLAQRKVFVNNLKHEATGITTSVWFEFPNEVRFGFVSVPTLPALGKLSDMSALITCAVGPLIRAGGNVLELTCTDDFH